MVKKTGNYLPVFEINIILRRIFMKKHRPKLITRFFSVFLAMMMQPDLSMSIRATSLRKTVPM